MLSLRLPGGMATPVGCRPAEFLGLLSGDGAESVLGAGADARSRVVDGGAEVGGGGVGPPGVELEPAGGDRGLAGARRARIAIEERDEGGERGVGSAGAVERDGAPEARILGELAAGAGGAGEGGGGDVGSS